MFNNLTFTGTINLAGDARIGFISTSVQNNFNGQITGSGGVEFATFQNGNSVTGTFTLGNTGTANNYTGNTTISDGDYGGARTGGVSILKLTASNQIPNGIGNGNLVFTGTDANHLTVFELNGQNETVNGVSNTAAAGAIIRNTSTGASTLTIGDADTTSSFSGVITDGGSGKTLAITKIGAGRQTLSGANYYTGVTTISAGTLQFANEGSLYNNTPASWTAAKIVVGNGGTLGLNVGGTGEFTTGDVTTLLGNLGGANGTGSAGFAAGSTIAFDTTNASGGTFTVANALADSTGTGGGAVGLTKLGAGTLALTNANSFTGPTTVSAGTLQLGDGTSGNDGTIANTSGVTNNAALVYNRFGDSTASYAISGTGTVTKLGAGTQILSGANTYTGATNVNAGKLYINGNQTSANGNVTVASAATLGGTGTIGGATTIQSGGIYSPGTTSPGTLTQANGLSINGRGIFNWNNSTINLIGTAGTDWSVANLTGGSLTLDTTPSTGSKLQLSFTNAGTSFADSFWNTNRTWTFITGGVSMAFDPSNISILINGVQLGTSNTVTGEGAFTTVASGNNEQLVWTTAQTGYTYTTYSTVDYPGIGPASADYDNDGLSNLIEYLLGTDPTSNTNGSSALTYSIVGTPGSQHNRLVFTRPGKNSAKFPSEGTVGYKVQVSNDLVTWTTGEITIPGSTGSNVATTMSGAGTYSITVANPGASNETETVTVDDSTNSSTTNQRFMRFAGSL